MGGRWHITRRTAIAIVMGLWLAASAAAGEPIAFQLPAGARGVLEKGRQIGWGLGLETNYLTVLKTDSAGSAAFQSIGPLAADARFAKRSVSTPDEWLKVRAELKKRMLEYFGTMPPRDLPLDVKVEQPPEDRQEYTFQVVSIAFDKDHRGKIALLVPRGLPDGAPAILLNDRWGGGIDRAVAGTYSRAIAAHFVREGFVVAVINHWDDRFGDSSTLCTAGAAAHMVLRTIDYLGTLKGTVDPARVGYWGHVYGADLIPFIASCADGIACFVSSCTCHTVVRPYDAAFWSPPFWARQGDSMGMAKRTTPTMYYSARSVATNPLPFLTQEIVAFVAPRPMLVINADQPELFVSARPVWGLFGRERMLELIAHKWGTNEPVNARDYTVDFFLRAMAGIDPGKPPAETIARILADLRSDKGDTRIAAARLAGWWRCSQAADLLAGMIDGEDVVLRRAAAKALHRIGEMKRMIPHLRHADPMVRLSAVEMMQVVGTEEAFGALVKDDRDADRWVKEAKWQTLQVNPWE